MRPINLIPEEQRRAAPGSTRTGPLVYIAVGSLAALLLGVVMVILTGNQISEREGEVEALQREKAAATARAERLAPYASFQQLTEQRTQTIASLADSRFDWERVIKQLALVLPAGVYLDSLTGSAGGGSESAVGVSGPSLSLSGCAPGQDAVAGFVASLREIDGVTRVGLNNSTLSGDGAEAGGSNASACSSGRKAQFEIVVAFDAAPPSPNGTAATEAPSEAEGEEADGADSEGDGETEGTAEGTAASAIVEPGG